MRRALLQYVDEKSGSELNEIVLKAVRTHKAALL